MDGFPSPHNIAILVLIHALGFKLPPLFVEASPEAQNLPPTSTLTTNILQLLIREVLEVSDPPTFGELLDELRSFASSSTDGIDVLCIRVAKKLDSFAVTSNLFDFYTQDILWTSPSEDDPDHPQLIDANSPLGQFMRRQRLAFTKLTFEGTIMLQRSLKNWIEGGEVSSSSATADESGWKQAVNEIRGLDETLETRLNTFEKYKSSLHSGDYSSALSSLHKFFDYRFPNTGAENQRGLHQHALLNLAQFHYTHGELTAAKRAVEETIKISRAVGDDGCLETALSLHQRMQPELSLPTSLLPTTPLDQIWDLKRRLDLGESVTKAFQSIYVALGTQEELSSATPTPKDENSTKSASSSGLVGEGEWHIIQGSLWSDLGDENLACVREDLALSSDLLDSGSRLGIICSKASRFTKQGLYSEALSILLEPSTFQSLSLLQYSEWADAVWTVLEVKAKRQNNAAALRYIASVASSREPIKFGPGGPLRFLGHPAEAGFNSFTAIRDDVCEMLAKAKEYMDVDQPTAALEKLLAASQVSSRTGLLQLYRLSIVALADVSIQMDMELGQFSLDLVDEVLDQIVVGADEELQGYAQLVRAQALIHCVGQSPDPVSLLYAAIPHLQLAITAFSLISAYKLQLKSLKYLAFIYNAIQEIKKRDEVSDQYERLKMEILNGGGEEELYREIGAIVGKIGAGIAAGAL